MIRLCLIIITLLMSACTSASGPVRIPRDDDQSNRFYYTHNLSIEDAKKRYDNNSDDYDYAIEYAKVLYREQQYDDAAGLIKTIPDDILNNQKSDYYFFANVCKMSQEIACVKQWLSKAIEHDHELLDARMGLAQLYEEQKEWLSAEKLYLEILEDDDRKTLKADEDIQLKLAYIYNLASQERLEEAGNRVITLKTQHPYNHDVERNRRIIIAMMQSYGKSAPKPAERPVTSH